MDRALLDKIIKAYDIRGLVDDEITPDFAFSLGIAFAKFVEREREPATVVVGEDMRPSSPDLATAFSDGITSQGLDVIRIGLSSTDQLILPQAISICLVPCLLLVTILLNTTELSYVKAALSPSAKSLAYSG